MEQRLTFDGPGAEVDDLVVAWTPDSRRIVFLSSRTSPVLNLIRAYSVSVEGGSATPSSRQPSRRA